MTGLDCEVVRDLLPELAAGSMDPEEGGQVEAHLRTCPACQEEMELVSALKAAQPQVPSELEGKIQARIHEEYSAAGYPEPDRASRDANRVIPFFRRPQKIPAWALSAAAVLMMALGTSLIWNQRGTDVVQDPIVVAAQDPLPEAWLWDDGMVAGAPVFDGLSDEDLEALIEEFEG